MESLSALTAGRADEHDVARRPAGRLRLYLCNRMFYQSENCVQVDG
jgi:hypothetical protein